VGLVSDRAVRAYNRTYRGRDAATDVLAFPADRAAARPGERHLGDIVVAVPTAARQAAARRHSLQREIKLLVLHAYLHLLGYDHEQDQGQMLRLQGRLARQLLETRR
jgi:probable rRNA maturation factor